MRNSSSPRRSAGEWLLFGATRAALAVLIALTSYALLTYALARPIAVDVTAYWNAAERLRDGETLYAAGAANASDLYRYAPWFAFAWIPLTYLPFEAVASAWVGLMAAAALVSTVPLLRLGPTGWAAFAFFLPLQLQGAAFGNVQPLLVLVLMWGVNRRSGPIWIALGASLKAVPLALALVYAGRGEWRRAAIATGLTAILVAPMLFFDLSGYSTDPGPNQDSLAGVSPFLYVPVAVASLLATYRLAPTPHGWAAGAFAMIATLPRLLSYQATFMLVGLANGRRTPPS
jgi:Glycosyltransferase family 87